MSKHRLTSGVGKRMAITAIGSAVAATAALAVPNSASATPSSPKVIVSGGAGCNQQPAYLATHVTFVLNDGETQSSPFYLNVFTHANYYKVTFTAIPKPGAAGYAVVTCSNALSGASYTFTKAVGINRPNFGQNVSLNLKSG